MQLARLYIHVHVDDVDGVIHCGSQDKTGAWVLRYTASFPGFGLQQVQLLDDATCTLLEVGQGKYTVHVHMHTREV